jgi:hypothetical protein
MHKQSQPKSSRRKWLKRAGIFVPAAFGILPAAAQMAFPRARGFRYPAAAGGDYTASAATFDGTDYLLRNASLTGQADSKYMLFSCWVKLSRNNAIQTLAAIFVPSYYLLHFYFPPNDKVELVVKDDNNNAIVATSSYDATGVSTWIHIALSVDLNSSSNRALYVNGSADSTTWSVYDTSKTFKYGSISKVYIGAYSTSQYMFAGDLSEMYFGSTSSFYDLSQSSNLEKFRSSGGKPVNLGSDGSTPTGSAPLVYWNGQYNSGANASGAGDLTIAGTLENATAP